MSLRIGTDGFSLPLEPVVELAGQAGYSNAKSGGFAAPLARLLELGFAEPVRPGVVRGSEMLFLKGKGRGK